MSVETIVPNAGFWMIPGC